MQRKGEGQAKPSKTFPMMVLFAGWIGLHLLYYWVATIQTRFHDQLCRQS